MNYQFIKLPLYIAILLPSIAMAGPYTGQKNNACPDKWSDTKKEIPVIDGDTPSPWGNTADKNTVKAHLINVDPEVTVDNLPVSDQDLVDDLLTVASSCLVYRNFEVDTAGYVTPTGSSSTEYGWIPAAVF